MITALFCVHEARSQAEVAPLLERDRPEVPDFEPIPKPLKGVLPPARIPRAPETIQSLERARIDRIDVKGDSVLGPTAIREIVAPFEGRELDALDIFRIRDALTEVYRSHGYLTTRVVIPVPQDLTDGVAELEVLEGTLDDVLFETDGRFKAEYFERRLDLGGGPLNVFELEKRLQRWQRDDRIRRLNAELLPGETGTSSILRLEVAERTPYEVRMSADNHRSPTVGAYQGVGELRIPNLTGIGDRLMVRGEVGEGVSQATVFYERPFTRWDTAVVAEFQWTRAEVVEDPFDVLDIESEAYQAVLRLSQPLHRSQNLTVFAWTAFEWQRIESYLLGESFSFVAGADDGVSTLSILRFGFDATYRSREQVLAIRSVLSRGLNLFDSTTRSGPAPDSEFLSWLNQIQFVTRLPWLEMTGVLRFENQLTSQSLLGTEQLTVGGHSTVRGYRESQLLRDNGVIGNAELRLPIWRPNHGIDLELSVFSDIGHAWNEGGTRPEIGPSTLASIGVGIRLRWNDRFAFRLDWAEALKQPGDRRPWDLQDSGFHFRVDVWLGRRD